MCENNPSQIAWRVRKLPSEESKFYETSKQKFSAHLSDRGYSEEIIKEPLKILIREKETYCSLRDQRTSPTHAVSPGHSVQPSGCSCHSTSRTLEYSIVNKFIPQDAIFASYSQPKSMQSLFLSTFSSTPQPKPTGRCYKYKLNCTLCKFHCIETYTIKSYHTLCDTQNIGNTRSSMT